ncbi:MAG: hypothetical protein WBQ48_02810 [Aeromicrobium sp.]
MSRVDEFDSFYRSAFAEAVEVTYALCGDRQVALEATTDAFRRTWRDWAKIRDRDPLGHVRTEAWRATALSRSTHPLRRRHEDDSDIPLLDALGDLHVDERRLIVLMTLGRTDLEVASREVGIPAEDGIEQVTNALAALEKSLGQTIAEIEHRMHTLGNVTSTLAIPDPTIIRRAARRGRRRNTVLLVAAAVLGVIGSGVIVTDDDALAMQTTLPDREKIGDESTDIVLDARKIDTDDLLTSRQVSRLNPRNTWTMENTDDDITNTTPYATCPTTRFADPDPLRVLVRTFTGSSESNERIVQSIEVSSSQKRARQAARAMIRTFADCEHPRVQLVSTHTVKRSFGDFTILRLASHRSPRRTFTIGLSQSGSATSTVVHEIDGKVGPDIDDFARTLNDSISKICKDSGGKCADVITVTQAEPPRTTDAPDFLGVVDLPPIADVDRVWAAAPADPDPNPAATTCDRADFGGKTIDSASSRVFVLYQASELPDEFGLTETVGRFSSKEAAKKFVAKIKRRIESCPTDNLAAKIDQTATIKDQGNGATGYVWRVGLEVSKGDRAYYRVGIVRRGADVAQVTFTPADEFDMSKKVFTGITTRAGTRLRYADLQQ